MNHKYEILKMMKILMIMIMMSITIMLLMIMMILLVLVMPKLIMITMQNLPFPIKLTTTVLPGDLQKLLKKGFLIQCTGDKTSKVLLLSNNSQISREPFVKVGSHNVSISQKHTSTS